MRSFSQPGRSPVHSMHGMACTSQTLSTQVAIDVLQAGGNAMDAAIAAVAMQCVVEPGSTGVGGDCFAMYAPGGKGKPIAFNGSGRAPAAATCESISQFGDSALERQSVHSVVVPGAVDAWTQLHRDHGHMPFAEVLQPAINTARNGYPIASRARWDIEAERDFLIKSGRVAELFLHKGQVPEVGSVIKLPGMADVLTAISEHGNEGFYQGAFAEEMVDELQSRGGLHTLTDFANVQGNYVEPISSSFRGNTVYELPPAGQGVIALMLLNMMSKLPVTQAGPMSAERIHLELEACRLAYGARAEFLGDPDQSTVPVEELLSEAYTEKLCAQIDEQKASTGLPVVPLPEHKDTVYISVVDKDRNVCSFINTIYWRFAGGICSKSGIIMTNRGMSFSLDKNSPNCIAPNKRPLHTIIPAMMAEGMADDATDETKINLCFGVMGGDYQAMGHQQLLTRYLDYDMDIQEAMDLPRFMVNPHSGLIEFEGGVPAEVKERLLAMGHELADDDALIGGSQAIAIDWQSGVLTGGSDPRKDGCAMGY